MGYKKFQNAKAYGAVTKICPIAHGPGSGRTGGLRLLNLLPEIHQTGVRVHAPLPGLLGEVLVEVVAPNLRLVGFLGCLGCFVVSCCFASVGLCRRGT